MSNGSDKQDYDFIVSIDWGGSRINQFIDIPMMKPKSCEFLNNNNSIMTVAHMAMKLDYLYVFC